MNSQQTVKIFLAEGNPTGLRILELLGSDTKGIIFPRDSFNKALGRDELNSQGVYFLYSESGEFGPELYIGESESVAARIKDHIRKKEFWDIGICFVSSSQSLSKGHVKFLEEMLIAEVCEAGRVKLQNGQQSKMTKLTESDEAWMVQFAENIKIILASVGYTFLKKPTEYEDKNDEVYICSGAGYQGRGIYSSEGMIVLAGSDFRMDFAKSVNESFLRSHADVVNSGLLEQVEEKVIFTKDYVFKSPSAAANAILGRHSNGWIEWKRESDGKTLDEVYR